MNSVRQFSILPSDILKSYPDMSIIYELDTIGFKYTFNGSRITVEEIIALLPSLSQSYINGHVYYHRSIKDVYKNLVLSITRKNKLYTYKFSKLLYMDSRNATMEHLYKLAKTK